MWQIDGHPLQLDPKHAMLRDSTRSQQGFAPKDGLTKMTAIWLALCLSVVKTAPML